jgi:hypothetical protein
MASKSSAIALSDTQRADARAEVRLSIVLAMIAGPMGATNTPISRIITSANEVMDRLKEERDKEAGLR